MTADPYRVDQGEVILLPDPDSSRQGRAARHLLAGLEWRRSIHRHPSGAYGVTANEPMFGGLALVWRSAESILGRGVAVDFGAAGRILDEDWRARLGQALLTAWAIELGSEVRA